MSADTLTYRRLIDNAMHLYREERYREGIVYLNRHAHKVEGNLAQIYNLLYSLTARAGGTNLAIAIFQEAVEEKGLWYSGKYLRTEESIESMRGYGDFDRLVRICEGREAEAHLNARSELKIVAPSESEAKSEGARLLVTLHGDRENNELNGPHWEKAVEEGHVLALVQSSVEDFSDAYVWNDLPKGGMELKEHLATLDKKFCIPSERIVLGGFSEGCQAILHAILEGLVKARTLLLVSPRLTHINQWAHRLGALEGMNVHIVAGEQDDECLKCSRNLAALLDGQGIRNHLRLVEGLGHDFPMDFDRDIEAALGD